MFKFLSTARVLVCVGTGGVGKTTIAASLAYREARKGRKVLVLTVDPSQRLKTTLKLNRTGEWIEVPFPGLEGRLKASVMDVKKTFDTFVLKAAAQDASAEKILNNRLYLQLTTTLGGSQEFTALENLYAAAKSNEFDLIVLDTPPTQHAMDFLTAPEKLASIFTEGVARWFRDPKGKKENFWLGLFQSGTQQVLRALEALTGSEFMRELSAFFGQIHNWQAQLEQRAHESHRLLVREDTHFLMVAGFDEAKFHEAEKFAREIRKNGYRLSGMIVNRAFPTWLDGKANEGTNELESQFMQYYQSRSRRIVDFREHIKGDFELIELPELDQDINDLEGVEKLSQRIEKAL